MDTPLVWTDAVSITFDLDVSSANQRVIQKMIDLNLAGWSHCFELQSSTSLTPQGFQPIAWGIRYRVERKDDRSNLWEQDV
jgi:hypothetical protein